MLASLTLVSLLTPLSLGANDVLALRAERVIVRPGHELENAVVLIEDGRVTAVGTDVEVPEGARELTGQVACAGFLDPWSTLALEPRAALDGGTNPAVRTADAVDPWTRPQVLEEALRGGVTGARVQAGNKSVLGGLGSVIRPVPEGDGWILLEDACLSATVAISRGGRRMDVFDRLSEVDRLVGQLDRGLRYREGWLSYRDDLAEWDKAIAEKEKELEKDFKKAKKSRDKKKKDAEEDGKDFKEKRYKEDKRPKTPKWDPQAEVLARAAHGEVPLVVEIHRVPDLRELLEKTARFDRLRLVLAGATESAHFADRLAERRIPVIVWPAPMGSQRLDEQKHHDLGLAAELAAAGVRVLIGTGGSDQPRELRAFASLAVSRGLDRESALAAITSAPAETFDVGDQVGTIERGRRADVLLFDGDPLDTTSRLLHVVRDGEPVLE